MANKGDGWTTVVGGRHLRQLEAWNKFVNDNKELLLPSVAACPLRRPFYLNHKISATRRVWLRFFLLAVLSWIRWTIEKSVNFIRCVGIDFVARANQCGHNVQPFWAHPRKYYCNSQWVYLAGIATMAIAITFKVYSRDNIGMMAANKSISTEKQSNGKISNRKNWSTKNNNHFHKSAATERCRCS